MPSFTPHFGEMLGWVGLDMGYNSARRAQNAAEEEAERQRQAVEAAAAEARAREAERLQRILDGTAHINQQFAGFNGDFYSNIAEAFKNFYNPQIDRQAAQAQRAIALNPAGGSRQSSAYARQLGELLGEVEETRVNVRNRASDAATQHRGRVEESRRRLIDSAEEGETLDNLTAATSGALPSLAAPTSYDPMGDLFTRYLVMAANRAQPGGGGSGVDSGQRPLVFGTRSAQRNVT